jgi:hypothetical protein
MRRHGDIDQAWLMRSGHRCVGCDADPTAPDADVAEWTINEDTEGGMPGIMCPRCWTAIP